MIARLCRFKSCYPHQQKETALVAVSFCWCGEGAEPVRDSGAGGRPSEARKCREAAPVTRTVQRPSGGAYRIFCPALVAVSFCWCGEGAEPVRDSGAGGRPSEARKCREAAPVTRTVPRPSGGAYRNFLPIPRGYPFLLVWRRSKTGKKPPLWVVFCQFVIKALQERPRRPTCGSTA